MWRPRSELQDSYDVAKIGGGLHGLAAADDLTRDHGIKSVAVLEKSDIGSGAAGRNTTILRANYKTVEGARLYDVSLKLDEGPVPSSTSTCCSRRRSPRCCPTPTGDVRDG